MLQIKSFTFNPYQENTYVLFDETLEGVVIDPGMYTAAEQSRFRQYLESENLSLRYTLLTHGHIDHMLGMDFVVRHWGTPIITHEGVREELEAVPAYAHMLGLSVAPSPPPDRYVQEGDSVTFGNTTLEVLFTPGHSAGHISFFDREGGNLFSGDVLFKRSIGRTDLPGGSMPVLMESIIQKLFPLGDGVRVFNGHGPVTTLGEERKENPFVLSYLS